MWCHGIELNVAVELSPYQGRLWSNHQGGAVLQALQTYQMVTAVIQQPDNNNNNLTYIMRLKHAMQTQRLRSLYIDKTHDQHLEACCRGIRRPLITVLIPKKWTTKVRNLPRNRHMVHPHLTSWSRRNMGGHLCGHSCSLFYHHKLSPTYLSLII